MRLNTIKLIYSYHRRGSYANKPTQSELQSNYLYLPDIAPNLNIPNPLTIYGI